MSSSSSQFPPWPPYDNYRDCSQGICSVYCPQWCYIIFPPPPPTRRFSSDGGSSSDFSPLIIAVIGILASAFILITYYTIISKYCRRRGAANSMDDPNQIGDPNTWHLTPGPAASSGLDESVIKSITVLNYRKDDGFVEGSDCSVCLSEFQEDERLRLLPKCNHAFHVPCIDGWLKSHATCPLCRANINGSSVLVSFPLLPLPAEEIPELPAQQGAATSDEGGEAGEDLEAGGKVVIDCGQSESEGGGDQHGISGGGEIVGGMMGEMRRSSSLNFVSSSSGSSGNIQNEGVGMMKMKMKMMMMKRSVSTGGFMFGSRDDNSSSNAIPV